MKGWFRKSRSAAVALSVPELDELGMLGVDSPVVRAVPYLLQELRNAEIELLGSKVPCESDELHRIRGKIQAFEQVERKWLELVGRCVKRVKQ